MAHRPRGTVTFLFTDVEGSTRLLGQLRERYGAVLATRRRTPSSTSSHARPTAPPRQPRRSAHSRRTRARGCLVCARSREGAELVRQSGTAGARVTFWGWSAPAAERELDLARSLLTRLGYRVSVKAFPDISAYFDALAKAPPSGLP